MFTYEKLHSDKQDVLLAYIGLREHELILRQDIVCHPPTS